MLSNFADRRGTLRLVHPDPVAPDLAAAHFYDRTISAVWRLATGLYPADVARASDAVVEAYRSVWIAGPRDQATLLRFLLSDFRAGQAPVPA